MKSRTKDHPKFRRLKRELGLPTYAVVGVLESLWYFTASFCDDGDLSRFDDQDIADAIDWDQTKIDVVKALVTCGWLDRTDDGLRVHDWLEHCPRFVTEKYKQRQRRAEKRSTKDDNTKLSSTVGNGCQQSVPTQSSLVQSSPVITHTSDKATPLVCVDDVCKTWNEATGQSCRPTAKRKASLNQRASDPWWRKNWRQAVKLAGESDFYMGGGDRGWVADLEWFLRPDSVTKLIEESSRRGKQEGFDPDAIPNEPPVNIGARRRQIRKEMEAAANG